MRVFITTCLACLFFAVAAHATTVSLVISESDTGVVSRGLSELSDTEDIEARYFTHAELHASEKARTFLRSSDVILVDVMHRELPAYLDTHVDFSQKSVFALRGSRDTEGLKKKGYRFDDKIRGWYSVLTEAHVASMARCAVAVALDRPEGCAGEPVRIESGIYHPDAPELFDSREAYRSWYHPVKGAPWIGVTFYTPTVLRGDEGSAATIIRRLEKEGFNVLPCFGREKVLFDRFLLNDHRKGRVDLVLAFSMKFYSALSEPTKNGLRDLDVPVINAVTLYSTKINAWRKDPVGIPVTDLMWAVGNPEISGLIEPTPLEGKVKVQGPKKEKPLFATVPIEENMDRLMPRLKRWIALQRKPNAEKKLALLYYNHSQGKQNIGASYLNVFRSIETLITRFRQEGYRMGDGRDLSEAAIKEMILRTGRNIGSWAPGELDKLLAAGKVVRIPMATYAGWFRQLPNAFQDAVIKQWGPPESSSIMVKDGQFILPVVMSGNLVMMPEPSRGWGDDPMKLYHDPSVWPHHQYIAAYLWIQKGFKADAMIHLGTHATYEWLPGKQAGLSPSCPPEVMVGDLPNVYPYIVDDVGEGIQAKRRGRGVIIDHMTPLFQKAGLHSDYATLYELINRLARGRAVGSATVPAILEEIKALSAKTGFHEELSLSSYDEGESETLEHAILELKETLMPHGLHTFGMSPSDKEADDFSALAAELRPGLDTGAMAQGIRDSGNLELERTVRALSGRFVPAGEGNDPIRNPLSVPTGKNFYGISSSKIPTREAWKLGAKAGEQILQRQIREKGEYPEKVAVILWATETLRNEGINESTILWLMGVEPVWDASGRVSGTRVVPGAMLGRPRIDVLINPSGLYRDLFPEKMTLLDKAVQQAIAADDVENFLAKHSARTRSTLEEQGISPEQAEILSRVRIFTGKPGTYGNGVSEMTGMSGFWESDQEIADVWKRRTGFAFGQGLWGEEAQGLLAENLKNVSATVHSSSSALYGTMDNDDVFQYLGGLSLAVEKETGTRPDVVLTRQGRPDTVTVEGIDKTIGRELRSRYINPKWIEAMKKEDYAGAREMAHFVEYMWGWQVTVPHAVKESSWQQTYDVYVNDSLDLDLKTFFNKANPWAYQSLTARMLESVRKGYWTPDESVTKNLAREYAVGVIEKGVACCDHTCNNPLLNQMVVTLISMPGMLSPEMVEKFTLAMEEAVGTTLENQRAKQAALHDKVLAAASTKPGTAADKSEVSETDHAKQEAAEKNEVAETGSGDRKVQGYKMEKIETREETTKLSSSGVMWYAAIFLLGFIGLFAWGMGKVDA
ncbi:cobaltochelatase subunit CobN [Desulfoluna butyratoxydans]|uniref:Cobn/magnesium chelatase n=1 Tax=Desulfoluna butyratoxydans TaxID=231438 RepID=A0A4U8YR18_9BACT|nr:cobaltochelatase subunit CobN [Desulfoluna butyratoxydans]VFQ46785.1 cobn/magnesium chelatase [Desulfoluna butyratoxydans]